MREFIELMWYIQAIAQELGIHGTLSMGALSI